MGGMRGRVGAEPGKYFGARIIALSSIDDEGSIVLRAQLSLI